MSFRFSVVFSYIFIIKGSTIIGSCKFDLWTVYSQPGHFFLRKWVHICDLETNEKKGDVLLSMGTFQQEGQHDDWHIQTGGSSIPESRESGPPSSTPSTSKSEESSAIGTAPVVAAVTSTITTTTTPRKRSLTPADNLLFSPSEELCYYTVTITDGGNLVTKQNNKPYLKVCEYFL